MSEARPKIDRWRPLRGVPLHLAIRVGSVTTTLRALTALEPGTRLTLDREIGAPFDLLIEGRHVAGVIPVAGDDRVAVQLAGRLEDDDRD